MLRNQSRRAVRGQNALGNEPCMGVKRRDTDTEAVFVVSISQLLEFVDLVVGPQSRKLDLYSMPLDDSLGI